MPYPYGTNKTSRSTTISEALAGRHLSALYLGVGLDLAQSTSIATSSIGWQQDPHRPRRICSPFSICSPLSGAGREKLPPCHHSYGSPTWQPPQAPSRICSPLSAHDWLSPSSIVVCTKWPAMNPASIPARSKSSIATHEATSYRRRRCRPPTAILVKIGSSCLQRNCQMADDDDDEAHPQRGAALPP